MMERRSYLEERRNQV
ncbi:Protein of unknown function [Bacillus cytotoxicus]|nr:Protein of unknown function [Bacillus cytotoxicus]